MQCLIQFIGQMVIPLDCSHLLIWYIWAKSPDKRKNFVGRKTHWAFKGNKTSRQQIEKNAEGMHPSFSEIITAIAFCEFSQEKSI